MLSTSLPGLELVDPLVDRFDGQIVYLDFDGEEDVTYNGPVTVADIDVPRFELPAHLGLANAEAAVIDSVLASLNDVFDDAGVQFVPQMPRGAAPYSTVYVGGDDSAFAEYGSFLGLAERVDFGNADPTDEAFVFAQNLVDGVPDLEAYSRELAHVIAHETGHLVGLSHQAPGVLGPVMAALEDGHCTPLDEVAHKTIVHQHIARHAIALLNDRSGDAWKGSDFLVSENGKFGQEVYEAVEAEDILAAPWGGDYRDLVFWSGDMPFLEHFFDPDRTDASDHLAMFGNSESALDRAEIYWNGGDDSSGGDEFVGLLSLYESGLPTLAWSYLGRVAHLVQDMTVPAHVHLDPHAGDLFTGDDNYEEYMVRTNDDNGARPNYEIWGYDDVAGVIPSFSSLESLFRTVAEITDNFDSDDVDGEFSGSQDINRGEVEFEHCRVYGDTLMSNAIRYTASLLGMFIDGVKPTIEGWAPARASSNVVVDVTPDGEGSMGIEEVEFQSWDGSSWKHAATDESSSGGWKGTISLAGFPVGSDVEIRARALDQGGLYSDWAYWTVEKVSDEEATGINVTADASSTDVGIGERIPISGSAYYDNGLPVQVGTATIAFAGQTWTAAVSDADYETHIKIPFDAQSGTLKVTVRDTELPGGLTGEAELFLSVDPANTHFFRELWHAMVDDYGKTPRDGSEDIAWYSEKYCLSPTHEGFYRALIHMEGISVFGRLKQVIRRPDGSTYRNTKWDVPHEGEDSWYWRASGWNPVRDLSDEGVWTVDWYYAPGPEVQDYTKIATDTFTYRYEFTEHRMARDVQSSDPYMPIGETNLFYQNDVKALTWANVDKVSEPLDFTWKFYEPNGSLYATETYTTEAPPPNGCFDWHRAWGWIWIDGHSAAQKTGDWYVDVFIKNNSGIDEHIYSDYFRILERPAQPPVSSLSVSNPRPFEGDPVSINVSVTDNTYLDSVTLYWDDGAQHSHSWSNLFSGSLNETLVLDPIAGQTSIEYWGSASDTSGNTTATRHQTIVFKPSAPSNLLAAAASAKRTNLSWQDTSNIESGFKVERKVDGGESWTQVALLGPGVTHYQDTGLLSNTTYHYRVAAYNAGRDSLWANAAPTTTMEAVTVVGTQIGNGSAQRSTVRSLGVKFSEDVWSTLTEDRLVLRNLTTGQDVPVRYDPNEDYDHATNTATWDFPDLPNAALPEGNYACRLYAIGITGSAGNEMEPDYYDFEFHVLDGDSNGDRVVNVFDLLKVRQNYLKPPGPERDDGADVNCDEAVDVFDLLMVRQNYFRQLEVPFDLVVPYADLDVPEGGTAEFTVALSAQPRFEVVATVERTGGDEDLSVMSGATLTFDNTNWNVPQPVTLAAAEDVDPIDGVAEFTIFAANATNQPLVTAREDDNDSIAAEWYFGPPLNYARYGLDAIEHQGRVYAIGGWNGGGRLEVLKNGAWGELSPLPESQEGLAAARVGNEIYTFGDYGGSTICQIYSIDNDSWSPGPAIPERLYWSTAEAVGSRICLIGGWQPGGGGELDTLQILDTTTGLWSQGASLPHDEKLLASAVYDGEIFVFGSGFYYRYDVANNSWHPIAAAPSGHGHAAEAVTVGDKIYLIGGNAGYIYEAYTSVEVYDPVADTWAVGPDLNVGRYQFGAVLSQGSIYAVGGRDENAAPLASCEVLLVGGVVDDFEDGVIAPDLWVYGGSKRAWAPDAGPTGNWSYSHLEGLHHPMDPNGYLQLRVEGPTSGMTFGAEAWIRSLYDYNDGRFHRISFAWEAEVADFHYNHYFIQITDGYVPPQSYNYIDWTYAEPRPPELAATTDLLWSTTSQGDPIRGAFLSSGPVRSVWSILISPDGTAELYDGPDGTGARLFGGALDMDKPWHVRFMVTDGTSAGFPAGDSRLNLFSFSSYALGPCGDCI